MKFAYADPPYLGCCQKYDHYHPDGLCWNDIDTHKILIERLMTDYPDGWALSLTVPSLWDLLPLIPRENTRICQWSKTFSAFRKGVRPAFAWEPIIVHGGRNPPLHRHAPPEKGGKQTTPKDFSEVWEPPDGIFERITMKKGLTGAKPQSVCEAILDWLNVQPGDIVDDLYVGTGIMGTVVAQRLRENSWMSDIIELGETDGRNWYCPRCQEPMLIPHVWDGTVFCLSCGYDSQDSANSPKE